VDLRENPLSNTSIDTYIPALEARGVEVTGQPATRPAKHVAPTVQNRLTPTLRRQPSLILREMSMLPPVADHIVSTTTPASV